MIALKSDLLLRIRDAEAEADEKVKAAEAEAQKIGQEARREAERIVADGKASADAAYHDVVATTRADAEEASKKVLTGGKRQATTLRKRFEDNAPNVTERVLTLFEEKL